MRRHGAMPTYLDLNDHHSSSPASALSHRHRRRRRRRPLLQFIALKRQPGRKKCLPKIGINQHQLLFDVYRNANDRGAAA